MLESVVGFVAKVAMWAFVVGMAVGIYLAVKYVPQIHEQGGVCVAPASTAPAAGVGPAG